MKINKQVIIVGGVPSPIGGVTSYISRLLTAFPNLFSLLLDLYPHNDKQKMDPSFGIEHVITKGLSFKAIYILLKKDNNIIHFNFSTLRSLILLFFLPKMSKQKWLLTLHNGDPISKYNKGVLAKVYAIFFKISLRKFERLICISSKQHLLYTSLGVSEERLVRLDSFVPYTQIKSTRNTVRFNLKKDLFKGVSFKQSIIMNGYCKQFYNFHYGIEYVLNHPDKVLIIALYGEQDHEYKQLLLRQIANSPNIKIVENLDQEKFNTLLAQADVYIRANSVDSFGVGVADAVCLGLNVVASDVCQRFDGAQLYAYKSKCSLFSVLDSLGENNNVKPFQKEDYCKMLYDKYLEVYDFDI